MNPAKLKPYDTAADIKRKIRWHEYEMQSYMNGLYTMQAIGALLDGKKNPYPNKLIGIFDIEKPKKELTEEEIKIKRQEFFDYLGSLKNKFEQRKKEQQESVS